jgi:hypothetical protein
MNFEQSLRALGLAPPSESDPGPPFDPNTIPRAQWPAYVACPLQLPLDIARYLEGRDYKAEPLTRLEIDSIEDRLTALYHLPPDFQATHAAAAFRLQCV